MHQFPTGKSRALFCVCIYNVYDITPILSHHVSIVYTQFKAKKEKNESGQTRSALHMHAFNSGGNSLPSSEASPELLDSTLSHPCHTNIHQKPCLPVPLSQSEQLVSDYTLCSDRADV